MNGKRIEEHDTGGADDMTYLRNTWYVAAWAGEVSNVPMGRKILDEQLVIYRDAGNNAVISGALCPHRFAPLDKGRVVDGTIECPYHGLRFNSEGRCVFNPDGDGKVPAGARLRIYPSTERWGCIWIWPGDADKADPDLIPEYEFLSDTAYKPVTGLLHVRANYRYIIDNLVDQAHLHMVHRDTLACDMVRVAKTELVKDEATGTIWTNRLGVDGALPNIFDMLWRATKGDYEGSMDHWAESGWNAPALVRNNTGVTLNGGAREDGVETKNSHFLTPETASTTHYFWSICRPFDLENELLDQQIREGTEYAFVHEDEVMLHAVQQAIGDRDFWALRPALLQADVGAVEIRRTLDRLIAKEQEVSAGSAMVLQPVG